MVEAMMKPTNKSDTYHHRHIHANRLRRICNNLRKREIISGESFIAVHYNVVVIVAQNCPPISGQGS